MVTFPPCLPRGRARAGETHRPTEQALPALRCSAAALVPVDLIAAKREAGLAAGKAGPRPHAGAAGRQPCLTSLSVLLFHSRAGMSPTTAEMCALPSPAQSKQPNPRDSVSIHIRNMLAINGRNF